MCQNAVIIMREPQPVGKMEQIQSYISLTPVARGLYRLEFNRLPESSIILDSTYDLHMTHIRLTGYGFQP